MSKIRDTIFMLLLFTSLLKAQAEFSFVNYGPKANKSEGDDNYIQVINFQLPENYSGNAFLRLYDISCGSQEDVVIGSWNSRFRFCAYKGELHEDDFKNSSNFYAEINKDILGRFEIGQDSRYYGKWSNFIDLKKKQSSDNKYSLVVEGVEGDDGNNFKIFISSDSLENRPIAGVKLYSYEPTISIKRNDRKLFFKIIPDLKDTIVKISTFDFDGTKCFISTLLKDEQLLPQVSPDLWSVNILSFHPFESANPLTFDIGVVNQEENDLTFFLSNSAGEKYPISLESYNKFAATIPSVEKKINFMDCREVLLNINSFAVNDINKHSYHWKFQDGLISKESSVKRTFDKAGKYIVECVVIDESSPAITRAKLEKIELTINDKPIARAGKNLVTAPNQKNDFNGGNSTDSDGKIINYYWNFGDGTSATGQKVSHIFNKPGTYKVELKVEDDYPITSCNYSTDTLEVIVNAPPSIVTSEKILGSPNQPIKFDASKSFDADGTITNYNWNFNELGVKEGEIVEMSFPLPGVYQITLTIKDNSTASNNTVSKKITVIVNQSPKAIITASRIIADNEEMIFDATKSFDKDGKIIEYYWDFGDGSFANGNKVKHSYKLPGNYKVILKVIDDSNTNSNVGTDSINVLVNDKPLVKIVNDTYLTDGYAKFSASVISNTIGTINKYLWKFGDGTVAEGKSVEHYYKMPGTYLIILNVVEDIKSSNNYSFDTSKVIINKKPIAVPGPDRIISTGQIIKFTSEQSIDPDGKIISNRWFIDNAFVSDKPIFEYSFSQPGNYRIGLEVTDDFKYPAKGISYCNILVNRPPIPSFSCSKNAAPKQIIKFDATLSKDLDGTIKEYIWNFSDGTSANGKIVEKSFEKSGVYTVILSVKDNANVANSIASDTAIVKINSSPIIYVDESIETCNNIVRIDASKSTDPDNDDLTYYWDFPNSPRIKGSAIVTHNFSERGVLPVILSIDDGLGLSNSISRKTIIVNIHQPPIADAGNDTTICANDILILSGLKSKSFGNRALQYKWTFSDSVKMEGSNIYRVFKKGGLYSVTLKVTDDSNLPCNSSFSTKLIKVLDAPIANAGFDITACALKPITFDGSKSTSPGGVVNGYNWEFGDGESGVGVSPIHIYSKPGNYKVTLTITGDEKSKCDNTAKDEINVTITEAPIASFTSRDSIPENYECLFDASSSSTSNSNIIGYEWNFGDGSTANGKTVKHKYSKYGNYNVTLTIKTDLQSECNSSSVTKLIYVNASPLAFISSKKECGVNEIINFDAVQSSDIDGKLSLYKWDFGDGYSAHGINVNHSYSKSGIYKVILTVFDETGIENNFSKDSVLIKVKSAPRASFQIPKTIQINEELVLDASTSNYNDGKIISYEWFLNDKKISNEKVHKIFFDKPGLQIIKLLVKGESGTNNYEDEIVNYLEVKGHPNIKIQKQVFGCLGEQLVITPEIVGDLGSLTYYWSKNQTYEKFFQKELNVKLTNEKKSVYYFYLVDSKSKVVFWDSTIVVLNHPPRISNFRDTTIYIGKANDEMFFSCANIKDEDSDVLKIKWSFGDGVISNEPNTYHRYEKEGVYNVEIEVDDQKNTSCSKVKTSFQITVIKH